MDASGWKPLIALGLAAVGVWLFASRQSRGTFGGLLGGVGAIDPEEDRIWSIFYQSEYASRRVKKVLTPTFDPSMTAAEARARLLKDYPNALDEPGIEEGSPVAPTRIIMPSGAAIKRMEAEGDEAIREKRRIIAARWREQHPEYDKSYYEQNKEKWRARAQALKADNKRWQAKLRRETEARKRRRASMTPEELAEYLRVRAEYNRRSKSAPGRKEQYAAAVKLKVASMTPEQRAEYRRHREELARERRKERTPEEKATLSAKRAEQLRQRMASMTPEQLEEHRRKNAEKTRRYKERLRLKRQGGQK